MTIAKTVVDCLQRDRISYDVVAHRRTVSPREAAESVHIPPERVAKAVLLRDRNGGYVMVVVPASRYVSVETLSRKLRRELTLAPEASLTPVFTDCTLGAIPPLGPAYGIPTVVDDSLVGQPEVFFEAGDHEELIRVSGEQFVSLLRGATYSHCSH